MHVRLLPLITFLRLVHLASALVEYRPILPPSYPLAVRSPYLSAWMPGRSLGGLSYAKPQFWGGQELNLGIMARIGHNTFALMSISAPPNGSYVAQFESAEYTATHTIFTLSCGFDVTVTLDFFSPVSPQNLLRQSLPFSYLTVSVHGTALPIQIYADFDSSWAGQTAASQNDAIAAEFAATDLILVHQLHNDFAANYSEHNDMALWGRAVFASKPALHSNSSWHVGLQDYVREMFTLAGSLQNLHGGYFHGDVAGIAQTIEANGSALFAIGHVRDNCINYMGTTRTGYYRSEYPDVISALDYFFADYDSAYAESILLDDALSRQALKVAGSNYSDILTLSVRQSYAALELTIDNETFDTNDLMIFLKEISSSGNVNTLDVLFPTFPIWYVMSPDYMRYTLEPIMRYMDSGAWVETFPLHDIGESYPNATGYGVSSQSEFQPVEESGNIILLAYAYSHHVGNSSWATQYLPRFQQFADWLVKAGLNMSAQLSADDSAGALPNQTNLAIKAAIGLNAFGKMFHMANYSRVGMDYAYDIYHGGLGTDRDKSHFTLQYGDNDSFTSAYNLYPDILFALDTFPPETYRMQSNFYQLKRDEAGLPLDSRVDWIRSDWALFCAAYSTIPETRDMFVNDIWSFLVEKREDDQVPFADQWYVSGYDGDTVGAAFDFKARPVVGGNFAILALQGSGTGVV